MHINYKEETSEVNPLMPEIPCQCAKTVTKGDVKITVIYPRKGNTCETELVNEVKHMMEYIVLQQIKKYEGEVRK